MSEPIEQTTGPILRVRGLRRQFGVRSGGRHATLVAVDDLDIDLYPGETVALVGESGSGKSTAARCIVRLLEPTSGEVILDGVPLTGMSSRELSRAYAQIQMVFQDPNSSLNPQMTVAAILEEPLRLHTSLARDERQARVLSLIEEVGLTAAHLDRYPSQLSGGQRQRIGIARALAADPKVLILDEPTASLDVSVRGRILELLQDVQRRRGVAYLFISHDLQVVERIAHRTFVLYLGNVVESGLTAEIFERPVHPYTRALITAAPAPEYGRIKHRFVLSGEIPSPLNAPPGCALAPRCPLAQASCSVPPRPPLIAVPTDETHLVACPPALAAMGVPSDSLHPPGDHLPISTSQ